MVRKIPHFQNSELPLRVPSKFLQTVLAFLACSWASGVVYTTTYEGCSVELPKSQALQTKVELLEECLLDDQDG